MRAQWRPCEVINTTCKNKGKKWKLCDDRIWPEQIKLWSSLQTGICCMLLLGIFVEQMSSRLRRYQDFQWTWTASNKLSWVFWTPSFGKTDSNKVPVNRSIKELRIVNTLVAFRFFAIEYVDRITRHDLVDHQRSCIWQIHRRRTDEDRHVRAVVQPDVHVLFVEQDSKANFVSSSNHRFVCSSICMSETGYGQSITERHITEYWQVRLDDGEEPSNSGVHLPVRDIAPTLHLSRVVVAVACAVGDLWRHVRMKTWNVIKK